MDIESARIAINGTAPTGERELRLVEPWELARYWLQVKGGVERVAEEASDGWLPEDVYMALKQNVSLLMVGYVANYYVGFVVLTPTLGWEGPQMHLWAVYNRGERDVLDTFLEDVREFARARGAVKITMTSCRKGWERRAVQLGFTKTQTQFALEV